MTMHLDVTPYHLYAMGLDAITEVQLTRQQHVPSQQYFSKQQAIFHHGLLADPYHLNRNHLLRQDDLHQFPLL